MSYKALYRSYRPKSFDDVVGQDHITETLKNILKTDKISHAYLFAGPRGTGKTSVAHIFANVLNCSDVLSKTSSCGKCEQCLVKINMDIVEIDAASNNGVGEIRKLIDDSKYAPSMSKYKIYIIDEIHMLSKGAFNALLKTLEEPSEHIIFILATTEPHKIPITILSRTQRFNFRRISNEAIEGRLKFVLNKEGIAFDEESIETITRLSNGGMRDALSMADQASAFSNQNLSFHAISTVFGIVSTSKIIELLNKIYMTETKEVLILSNLFLSSGTNITKLIENILEIIKDFIIFKKTSDINLLTTLNQEKMKMLNISILFSYNVLEEFGELLTKLRFSEYPSQTFELSLLKLLNKNYTSSTEMPIINDSYQEKIASRVDGVVKVPIKSLEDTSIFETNTTEIKKEINHDNLTSEIQIADEALENESDLIEEDILNTQEINLQNASKEIDSTDEIDIMNMFQLDNEVAMDEPTTSPTTFDLDEIINLIVLGNKDHVTKLKSKWSNIVDYISEPKFHNDATLLQGTKIITASEAFILITSKEDLIVREVNDIIGTDTFNELINYVLGEPYRIFAITLEEFEKVKEEYKMANALGNLPEPKEIKKPEIKKEENKAQSFGEEIFGDIFGS
ncbi:DNA polymerase III subunit gamma/tau [Candidatus Mycoplasma mahonii]|uniref:DNA polymerase III subunit gamma/tau n=1 Tax=Candidatus Mycoplasma mahonii TaxID=3004105 RepID=UPI0026E9E7CC|nr:DNA polymerase III subunit gamma/tau [Candidatus Mycoplasma mahonii]WKX02604.1 DNA polymerase III subunit gamma/tau [Candidatus Mycoplasma mahonii]